MPTVAALLKYWEYFRALPKTLIFNFRYFPFRTAIRLPVFISHRVLLRKLGGKVELSVIRRGIVKIGFDGPPLFDGRKSRAVLVLSGRLVFKGSADIGPGCQLGVSGELICGDGFAVTAFGLISTRKSITFGRNALISWDVSVIDHDWHDICDSTGTVLNPPKAVSIGDDVWLCCGVLILKGCSIRNGVVVAAGSTVTGSVEASNAIIGGGAKCRVLREGVFWRK